MASCSIFECIHACLMHSCAAVIPVEHPLESMNSCCLHDFYSGAYWSFHNTAYYGVSFHVWMQAMLIWAANQDSASELDIRALGKTVSREAAALVMEASNESAAARRLVTQMSATLAQSMPSMALLQLFLELVEIPSVKQVRCRHPTMQADTCWAADQ